MPKSMKKSKTGLQKQIFVLYFIVTFSLVFLLLFIIWQISQISIAEFEYDRISRVLTSVKSSQLNLTTEFNNLTNQIAQDQRFVQAIYKSNKNQIKNFVAEYKSDPFAGVITIYDDRQKIIYGENWELVDKYLSRMYVLTKLKNNQNFMATFSQKFYYISYAPLLFEHEDSEIFVGMLVNVHQITAQNLGISGNPDISIIPYTKNLSSNYGSSKVEFSDLEKKLKKILNKNVKESILRLNSDKAVGLLINYDLFDNPTSLVLYRYNRELNQFAQRGILFFFLILIALSLLIVSFLSNWFSRTIMQPVKKVSEKMQSIEENPFSIEEIEDEYGGELSNMITIFNSMNRSLVQYNKSLMEYKVLTDNVDIGILWMDSKLKILICNPSAMEILELHIPDEIMGKYLTEFIELDEKLLSKVKDDSLTLPRLEINFPTKKKFVKFVILNLKAVDDTVGLRMIATITDITSQVHEEQARESLEMEIIKSNKLAEIGRRVEGVVHNMNSPLNSILGYAQLLKKSHEDNEDIDKIIDAAKNMSHAVKTLLRKVQQDNISMLRPIDINELIEQELELLDHNLFFKHYVTLEKNFFSDLPKLNAVYSDISQSFTNLINNSIEALQDSKEKRIFVRTFLTSDIIAIEVRDTGEGIPEKDYNNIFEPYFTTKKENEQGGFGLGLAICKNVVERYGGFVNVKSKLGEGSIFTIFLPYK